MNVAALVLFEEFIKTFAPVMVVLLVNQAFVCKDKVVDQFYLVRYKNFPGSVLNTFNHQF